MKLDDRLRHAADAVNRSVEDLSAADGLYRLPGQQRRRKLVRSAAPAAIVVALVMTAALATPTLPGASTIADRLGLDHGTKEQARTAPPGEPRSTSPTPTTRSGQALAQAPSSSTRPPGQPSTGPAATAPGPTAGSPAPAPAPAPGPPPDIKMHEVWQGGADAHAHGLAHQQWAMTEFTVTQPFLRSVEVNIAGPQTVALLVYRHPAPDRWDEVVNRHLPVVQNGHTKLVLSPAIPVRVGETLFLQAFNVEQTAMAVYFSNTDAAPGRQSYLWCDGPADSCVHPNQDLNAIVYGWSRAS